MHVDASEALARHRGLQLAAHELDLGKFWHSAKVTRKTMPAWVNAWWPYCLAALPALLTAVVFRSLTAGATVALAPMYFVIGFALRGLPAHSPMLALDRAWPLQPAWMLVYGSLYVFVVILPLVVIRDRQLGERTLRAYIAVMVVAYAGFLLYPTAAPPRPAVATAGFSAWALRLAYDLDTPNNCFPSLHVAYAFVAALACGRVHRGVGVVAVIWAALIGLSTLFTKQHYVVDVVAGGFMGCAAYRVFLKGHRAADDDAESRRAAERAAGVAGLYAIMVAGFAIAYALAPR